MKIDTTPKYEFADVFIKPRYSEVFSRKAVDISQNVWGKKVAVPMVSANMDTVTDGTFAAAVTKAGGLGAIHRYMTVEENVKEFETFKSKARGKMCFCSLGTNVETEMPRFHKLYEAGARWFIIDIAHGASTNTMRMLEQIQGHYVNNAKQKDVKIVIGNVASPESLEPFFSEEFEDFVDGFKIGIGPGFVCTTKNVTGVTVPQFSAIADCVRAIRNHEEFDNRRRLIIADGGVREIGDIAKAIGAGADLVMSGKLFVECAESISARRTYPGHKIVYRGMASKGAMMDFHGKMSSTPEGREEEIESHDRTVSLLMEDIAGGLRSACSYNNSRTLATFRGNAHFGVRYK